MFRGSTSCSDSGVGALIALSSFAGMIGVIFYRWKNESLVSRLVEKAYSNSPYYANNPQTIQKQVLFFVFSFLFVSIIWGLALALKKKFPNIATTRSANSFFMTQGLCLGVALRVANAFIFLKNNYCDSFSLLAGVRIHSIRELIINGIGFGQSSPLGYTLLLKGLGIISDYNRFVLILPSLCASLFALYVFSKLINACEVRNLRGILFFSFATNAELMFYSSVTKQYAFDTLFVVCCSLVVCLVLEGRKHAFSIMMICFVLGPLFSMVSFLFVPICMTGLLVPSWKRGRTAFRRFLFAGLMLAPYYLLLAFQIMATMPEMMYSYWGQGMQNSFAPFTLTKNSFYWYLDAFSRLFRAPLCLFPIPYFRSFVREGISVLFLFIIFSGIRKEKTGNASRLMWIFISLVSSCLFASMAKKWVFVPGTIYGSRVISFLCVPLYFLVFWGLEALISRKKTYNNGCCFLLLMSIMVFNIRYLSGDTSCTFWRTEEVLNILSQKKEDEDLFTDNMSHQCLVSNGILDTETFNLPPKNIDSKCWIVFNKNFCRLKEDVGPFEILLENSHIELIANLYPFIIAKVGPDGKNEEP